ncbi:MAG TPA: hypothetical protein VF490_21775, partial [Chryseosolibacter sp.]
PLVILLVYALAYLVRPWVTDDVNRRYFFPALTVRILGALAVGFLYQFYYEGGDTFAYHTHGSRPLWEAMMESPSQGFRLLFVNGEYGPGIWKTASRIWYWNDPQSFFVIRIAAILDLFTFSTYSATAVLFSVISFTGAWMFFLTFYKQYPDMHRWIAFSVLFVPTVVFWGSGIFKDTITLAALGASTFIFRKLFIEKRITLLSVSLLLFSFFIIFSIKKYILLCFLPALLLWWVATNFSRISSPMLRIVLAPVSAMLAILLAYYAVLKVGEDDPRYNISSLAETAKITSYDIRYGWGARTGEGSGYTLGELDGSWQSMVRLAPQAINVSLFRPYLWEAINPLMFLSAIEGLVLLMITLYLVWRVRWKVFSALQKPDVLFCLVFAFVFAFAVGVSTFNFGTLSRYKIPMIPYFLIAVGLIHCYWKRDRKFSALDSTE